MKDYEQIVVPNEGNLTIDMICLTVSESRVGMFPAVLEALDKPDHILIHRGVRKNAGKLIVESTDEYCYGAILINFERKKISFFNKTFINHFIYSLIIYMVKGKKVEDGIEFDFREVLYREVKACMRGKKGKAKKPVKSAVKRSGSMTGFTMLGMNAMGMY